MSKLKHGLIALSMLGGVACTNLGDGKNSQDINTAISDNIQDIDSKEALTRLKSKSFCDSTERKYLVKQLLPIEIRTLFMNDGWDDLTLDGEDYFNLLNSLPIDDLIDIIRGDAIRFNDSRVIELLEDVGILKEDFNYEEYQKVIAAFEKIDFIPKATNSEEAKKVLLSTDLTSFLRSASHFYGGEDPSDDYHSLINKLNKVDALEVLRLMDNRRENGSSAPKQDPLLFYKDRLEIQAGAIGYTKE